MARHPSQRPASSRDARRPGRWRQWLLRSLGCLVGAAALGAIAVAVLLRSLDQPWLKHRLQELARGSTGVAFDYRVARVDLFSGAEIEGLVVQSPDEVRPFAPELLRVGRVEARWSLGSLLLGRGPFIARAAVSDVTLTVVVDEQGRTSFDALTAGWTSAPTPTVPLSRRASKLLGTPPPVGHVVVDRVSLALVRTDHGAISDRTELRGLAVTAATGSAEPTARGWRLQAGLGSSSAPLDLELTRARGGQDIAAARAKLWVALDTTSRALTAALDLRVLEQTFAPSVSAERWVHADARLGFDPAMGRTEIRVNRVEAGDGAATAEASIDVFDAGDPIVRRVRGDVDLARLLQWLPAGLVPVTAERARVRYEADSLVLGPVVRLSEGGTVAVDADFSNVAVGSPVGQVQFGAVNLTLRARPVEGAGVAGQGSVALAGTRIALGVDRLAMEDVGVDFDVRQGGDGVVDGRAGARFASVERTGPSSVSARDGRVDLRVEGLHVDTREPLAARGDVTLSFELAALDARFAGLRASLEHLTMHAHTLPEGHAPYAGQIEARVARLRVIRGRDGSLLADAPARIEGTAHDVQPDLAHPMASRGVFHAAVDVGEVGASLDATKANDAVDFALHATAGNLNAVRPWLPAALAAEASWNRMAVTVRSTGHIEHLGGQRPALSQRTEVEVERVAYDGLAARSVSLAVQSRGTAFRHQADVDVRAQGLAVDGGSPSDDRVRLSATVDRDRPSIELHIATEGRAATKLAASLSFDSSRRAIVYEVEGRVAGLGPLAPFAAKVRGLDAFDLSELEVGLSAHGRILGVVAGVSRDGALELEPSPARTAAIEGTTDLRVAHFRWARGDTAILTPALEWHADMRAPEARRVLDSRIEVGTLHIDWGNRDIDLNGIAGETSAAVLGSLDDPEVVLTQRLSVRAVEQNVVPEYPLGDIAFALSAERGPEGVLHISDMRIANGLGGTQLAVTGNVDLGEGRRTVSVTTSLTQDLARLSTVPERFKGTGKLAVDANVTSPDLEHYRVRAAVKGEDVTATLSREGIDVESANGEVPVTVALEVGVNGVTLQRSEKRSPYSMLRFADQHPLLSRSGFFSVARLKTPLVSIAPLVGNLEVEQNVVSLRQFEMGVRGGSITGQCGLDWDGPRSTLELHVRASGVQSSHGEPFDGNIAVAISAADRTIDGRAEILRIGERHLLDLLDLEDPLHVDPAMNRIRTALVFGYPDTLRLIFDHGFASAHLELGGLARLISISELRGIPMGPIVDRMLAPMLVGLDTKEAP